MVSYEKNSTVIIVMAQVVCVCVCVCVFHFKLGTQQNLLQTGENREPATNDLREENFRKRIRLVQKTYGLFE